MSYSAPAYGIVSNNLIIEWLKASISQMHAGYEQDVTLPKTLTTANYGVSATSLQPTGNNFTPGGRVIRYIDHLGVSSYSAVQPLSFLVIGY